MFRPWEQSTNASTNASDVANTTETARDAYGIYILAGLIIGSVLMSILRPTMLSIFTYMASCNLHNNMFAMVLHAPMYFFTRNPVGKCHMLNFYFLLSIFLSLSVYVSNNIIVLAMHDPMQWL